MIEIVAILAPTFLALVSILTNIYLAQRNSKLERHKLEYSDKKNALSSVIEVLYDAQSSFNSAKVWFDMLGPDRIKKNTLQHDMNNPVYQTLIQAVTLTPMEVRKVLGKNLLFFTSELNGAIMEYQKNILDKISSNPLDDLIKLQHAINEIIENYPGKLDKIIEEAKKSMNYS